MSPFTAPHFELPQLLLLMLKKPHISSMCLRPSRQIAAVCRIIFPENTETVSVKNEGLFEFISSRSEHESFSVFSIQFLSCNVIRPFRQFQSQFCPFVSSRLQNYYFIQFSSSTSAAQTKNSFPRIEDPLILCRLNCRLDLLHFFLL